VEELREARRSVEYLSEPQTGDIIVWHHLQTKDVLVAAYFGDDLVTPHSIRIINIDAVRVSVATPVSRVVVFG
jgi:hypothetical protein